MQILLHQGLGVGFGLHLPGPHVTHTPDAPLLSNLMLHLGLSDCGRIWTKALSGCSAAMDLLLVIYIVHASAYYSYIYMECDGIG